MYAAFEIAIPSELLSLHPLPAASPASLLSGPYYAHPNRLRHPPAGYCRIVDASLLEFVENYTVGFSSITASISPLPSDDEYIRRLRALICAVLS
eukprot:6017205-Pleurochrysis_carterae.AAC.1